MSEEYSRTQRVADQIQREVALLIQHEVKDPRVGMVTITAVKVSREFDIAAIYFTVFGANGDSVDLVKSTQEGLNKAAGFLRSSLARKLKIRTTPKLRFVYDKSVENGNRLSALINAALYDSDQPPSDQEES
jgi:ribosome-binding factor A